MSAEAQASEIKSPPNEINCHIPTLLSLSPLTPFLLSLPMEGWAMLSSALGYDGIEWRPIRAAAEAQIRAGKLSSYGRKQIKSAEQSFRDERSWKEASQQSNRKLAQVSYLLLPHRADSIDNLVRLQSLVGEIPFTVYPTKDLAEFELQRPLKNKIIQLAPDCLEIFRATSLEELVQRVVGRGYGINLDLLHYQRLVQALGIPADNETFRSCLPFIKEIQYPVARDDFKLPDGDQSKSLLLSLLNLGYKCPIVPEINPMAYGLKILQAHQDTVRGLKALTT